MSIPTSYAILTALEAELGRERVIAMAEAYLNGSGPLRAPRLNVTIPPLPLNLLNLSPVLGPAPGGGPVTPPGFDAERLPAPRIDADAFRLRRWSWDDDEAAGTPPGAEAGEPVARTPIRPVPSPRTPPGAPARPAHPGQLGPTVEGEPDNQLVHLMRTDPEHPLLCPRHEHIPRGGLGPSRNSSGSWGFYGPPPAGGCRICQEDAREDTLRNNMWEALGRAETERTTEAIAATRAAMAAYDAGGQGCADRTYVERGLEEVEAMEAAAAAAAARVHYCGDADCDGRCGVLDCGCIDICRGRCGMGWDRYRGGW